MGRGSAGVVMLQCCMFIGTAGWSIPKDYSKYFPEEGSHLKRYSQAFNMVEINSSFYREHQAKTYVRWKDEVPREFRFSVKLAQKLIHECGFKPKAKELEASLENILHLEEKLGVILIQTPGKMGFHLKNAERFYKLIRKSYDGPLAIEPRNIEWISKESKNLMMDYGISKVIADPERCAGGGKTILKAGGLTYYRLHGSPIIYRSSYSQEYLENLATQTKKLKNVWCVFDNTSFGVATQNALDLKDRLIS